MPLADVQHRLVRALADDGRSADLRGALVGGEDPLQRFAIHQRHYATSLSRVIVERFPATVWLAGSDAVADAAQRFVRAYPPMRPCLAEYGDAFPSFLGESPLARHLPYVAQFAAIDWYLGRFAVATDDPPIILHLDWSLDELFGFFLSGEAPDNYELRAEKVWLELHGGRGELSLRRLPPED